MFLQAEDGIRDLYVTGVQTCALPICRRAAACPDGDAAAEHELDAGRPQRRRGDLHRLQHYVETFWLRAHDRYVPPTKPPETRSEERRVGKEGGSCSPLFRSRQDIEIW